MNKKVEELYKKAHQLITQAKELLNGDDELTDQQNEQINAWLQQAEEIEKRAKHLESVLEKDLALAEAESAAQLAVEEKTREEKIRKAGFKHGWEYMVAIWQAREKNNWDPRLAELEHKDLAGETGVSGGFLIPTDQRSEILATRAEASIVEARARRVPMGSRVVDFPALDYTGGAAGVSAFFGGVRVYRTEENTNITESQPSFRAIQLHAHELAGYAEIPNGLLRDSAISLEAFLSGPQSFGGAMAWQIDYEALRGSGADGQFYGCLNAPVATSVSRNTASTFKFVDAVTMASKMIMSGSPVWIMNQSVMPQLYQMVDGATNNIWLPNAAGAGPTTLLGWPVLWTEKLPALGTAGDVMLIDFSWYLYGDRQVITMDIDRSFKFQANQTAFRVVSANAGQPWLNAAITLADGSTTVSPVLYLS